MRLNMWLATIALRLLMAVLSGGPLAAETAPTASHTDAQGTAAAQEDAAGAGTAPAYSLPPDKLAKAIALSRIRNTLSIVDPVWGILVLWLLLATHSVARLESWATRLASKRWIQGAAFFAAFIVITGIAGLPLDMIGHHYSRAYDISVQSWASWFGDQAKALGLAMISVPFFLLFNWIVRKWPRHYWFIAWMVTLPILVLGVYGEPFLEPFFDKYEPLQRNHAALVAELEKVVARTGTKIPPERMFLMKASLKSNGLNAYVSGLGATKRIVVWDTTAGRIPNDEVLFIFAHESGHYVLNHIAKGIACTAIAAFFVYWSCAAFAGWMVRRHAARWGVPDFDATNRSSVTGAAELSSRTGFVVLLFAVSIAGFLLQPVGSALSRHFEHEADVYGQEAIHGIVSDPQKTTVAAFNELGEAWLDDPDPNPFIEFWLYSHPSTEHRAEFAAHYDPWANGGRGEFFPE